MKYIGKLYGKINGEYIPLSTSEKFDRLHEALKEIIKETSSIELNTLMPLCRDNPKFEWSITMAKLLLKEIES